MKSKTDTSLVLTVKRGLVRLAARIRGLKLWPYRDRNLRFAFYAISLFLLITVLMPRMCLAPSRNVAYIGAASADGHEVLRTERQIQQLFDRFHMPISLTLAHEMTVVGFANHVDPRLIAAIIVAESSGNPLAVSQQNAIGLMQINAKVWAQRLDFSKNNPFDPETNIRMGVPILQSCLERYHRMDAALAAYVGDPNGSGEETQAYVDRIIRIFERTSKTKVVRTPGFGAKPAGTSPSNQKGTQAAEPVAGNSSQPKAGLP